MCRRDVSLCSLRSNGQKHWRIVSRANEQEPGSENRSWNNRITTGIRDAPDLPAVAGIEGLNAVRSCADDLLSSGHRNDQRRSKREAPLGIEVPRRLPANHSRLLVKGGDELPIAPVTIDDNQTVHQDRRAAVAMHG